MKKSCFKGRINKNGFTLIELLVVVLIIGILAAIALPQYQKAVWRSESAGLKQRVGDLARAQELYFLMHGEYASSLADLEWNGTISTTDPQCIEETSKTTYKICIRKQYNQNIFTQGQFTEGPYADGGFRYMHQKKAGSNYYTEKTLFCIDPYKDGWEGGKFCKNLLALTYYGGQDGYRIYGPGK